MTTLMSSGCRSNARMKSSGFSRLVTRCPSHSRFARARAWPALYQCRRLALTLPTMTLFRSTAPVATSAMVLKNNVIVGSVNANKRHWYKAGGALARADPAWLSQLITRRERPEDFSKALERQPDDIKVVIQFSEA